VTGYTRKANIHLGWPPIKPQWYTKKHTINTRSLKERKTDRHAVTKLFKWQIES